MLDVVANRCLNTRVHSLQDIARTVCAIDLQKPKSIVMSNWELRTLSFQQLQYAAYDAVIASHIYDTIANATTSKAPVIRPSDSFCFEVFYSTFVNAKDYNSTKVPQLITDLYSPVAPAVDIQTRGSNNEVIIIKPTLCSRTHIRATYIEVFYHCDLTMTTFMHFLMDSDEKWMELNTEWMRNNDTRAVGWQEVNETLQTNYNLLSY